MILVDERIGSRDLASPLARMDLGVQTVHLDYGDLAFAGQGVQGARVDIGIELKRINDLVASLRSGRLSGHQLPGLVQTYDHVWLVVEGYWKSGDDGLVQLFQGKGRGWRPAPGRMSATELEKQVLTLEMCGGLHVRFTNSRHDTLRFLSSLYHWWSDVALDRHTSHLAVHRPSTLVPLTPFEQAAVGWPGVGRRTAKAAEQYFGSVKRAVNGAPQAWAALLIEDTRGKTRKFGMKNAEKLIEFFRKGEP